MELDFDILTWFVGIAVLFFILVVQRHRRQNPYYIFMFSAFWIYILLLLKETLFPIPLTKDLFADMRELVPFMSRVNLIPFNFGLFVSLKGILVTSILNIVLTIPFGFGVGFIVRLRAQSFWWLSVMVGVGIEAAQLLISLSVNFPYRFVDINDVIMNSGGVWLGYGLFRIFVWLYLMSTRKFAIEHSGLSAYIYEVAVQAHYGGDFKKSYQ